MLSSRGLRACRLGEGGVTARVAANAGLWHAHGLNIRRPCWPARPMLACRASSTTSHYDLLGVDAESSDDEIKIAFRQAAKRLHPDVNKEPGAEKRFIRINEAYATLSDPNRRKQYDAELRARAASGSFAGKSGARSSGNGWVEYTWVVNVDDDSDDEDDEDLLEFFKWSSTGQNMRSSYQSSWQANSKKKKRQATAQAQTGGAKQQAGGARRQEVTEADRAEILSSLRTDARQYAQKVFGKRLEYLEHWKQMDEFLDALEAMHLQEMGLHSYDSDDDINGLFDSDDDDDDEQKRPSSRRSPSTASSSGRQATDGTRRSKNWHGDVDWETFVSDFDTGSASASKSRQRKSYASPFSPGGPTASAGARSSTSSRRDRQEPAAPKMHAPPKRPARRSASARSAPMHDILDDSDDDDDLLDFEELEQLLSVLVDTEDVGEGRRRASSRRPRGRRQ